MKKTFALLFATLMSLGVCARSEIATESYGDYNMQGKTFAITSMYSDIADADLKFQSYAHMLEQVLMSLGAQPAEKRDQADMIVRYGYGKRGETPRSFSVSTSSFSHTNYYNTSSFSIGTGTSIGTIDFDYDYYLYLDVYDGHSSEPQMLWKVNTFAEVSFDNERYAIFSMLFVSRKWMGNESKRVVYMPYDTNTTNLTFEKYVYHLYKHGVFQRGRTYGLAEATYSRRDKRNDLYIDLVHVDDSMVRCYVVNKYAAIPFRAKTYLAWDERMCKLDFRHSGTVGVMDTDYSIQTLVFDAADFDSSHPFSIVDNLKPKRTLSISDIHLF